MAAEERALAAQAAALAAALAEGGELVPEAVQLALRRLDREPTARLRVVDRHGHLLADSRRAAWPFGEEPPAESGDPYRADAPLLGPEVRLALAGAPGSANRPQPGTRWRRLYRATPVSSHGTTVGAVLASSSTERLAADRRAVRRAIAVVLAVAAAAAALASALLARTLARPLRALAGEAAALVGRGGRVRGEWSGAARGDEIGDLARALGELARRLGDSLGQAQSFAADLSHEFKNPLASIRGAAEMLAEVDDPAARRRFRTIVESEVARLEGLLRAVREVALLEAQLEAEERAPVRLADLVASQVERCRARGVAVELAVAPDAAGAVVDAAAERLSQVFDNLVDNAASFSPPGAAIAIELRQAGEQATIAVRDRGPGIPAEHLERVFERFFSYRPRQGGPGRAPHTGLGLAIVRTIVTAHGGAVQAHNAPDGGAVLEVRLPLARVADVRLR